ncbi:MAG: helix-turn-helix domain-containing protein [Defluviitaleaceae bacterium]|nr:helix-turn-helix domain-containing protein [Defluviitaleaceae bacterium]
MLSGQIIQSAISGINEITGREICVIDRDGKELAATQNSTLFSTYAAETHAFVDTPADSQVVSGCQFAKVMSNGICELVVLVRGVDGESYRIAKMAALHIQTLSSAYKERHDKDNFVKNLLMDNLLWVDIENRAKKLRIDPGLRRVAFSIETTGDTSPGSDVVEIVRNIFPEKEKDFIAAVDHNCVVLIKELMSDEGVDELINLGRILRDTLISESMSNVYISIGKPVTELSYVSGSFKEAKMAMLVGKTFFPGEYVTSYERLGIGRLFYHLPKSLCRLFTNEIFSGATFDQIDKEMTTTAYELMRNNLNLSETARRMMLHRNTLVYRIEKLKRLTGLDLRIFDDAVKFYIGMLVGRFIES